jgi:hypothetical protein
MIDFKAEPDVLKEISRNARFNFLPIHYEQAFADPANNALAMEVKGELKRQISWSIGLAGMNSETLEKCIWKDDVTKHLIDIINVSVRYGNIQG